MRDNESQPASPRGAGVAQWRRRRVGCPRHQHYRFIARHDGYASFRPASGRSRTAATFTRRCRTRCAGARHLRAQIEQAPATGNGAQTISFADFMQQVLYAPGLGYYMAGATKLGGAETLSPPLNCRRLFGATLADAFAPLGDCGVIELGAGTGKLARDFLAAARVADVSHPRSERRPA